MTIDKQKLQKLLWAEVTAWSVSAPDWPATTDALAEFLGKHTIEEVALELLAENEALRKESERYRFLRNGPDGFDLSSADTMEEVDALIDAAMGNGEQS